MRKATWTLLPAFVMIFAGLTSAQNGNLTDNTSVPNWWDKYQYLLNNGVTPNAGKTTSTSIKSNVDVSNECGPQSETNVSINPSNPQNLAGGSNEIFRLPMRGYSSSNNGASWTGVDLPLPPAKGNGLNFGSDPTLAYDTQGNVYYGYIVVYVGNGNGINGTALAVAKSTDGGKTYPSVTFFSNSGGSDHFNDKPMITADTNPSSPFRDNVYIAWDAASGGSASGGGIRVGASSDGGATFNVTRADNPSGPGRSIGTSPFVGPDGTLYVAWNSYASNTISFNRSFDGGQTWDQERVVASKSLPFDIGIPAEFSRGALVYASCDADRSWSSHRGRLYCSWMDITSGGDTDIFLSYSDDRGNTWSNPQAVTDQFAFPVDRFNHWLSVDAVTGGVNLSFYDTRNDNSTLRYKTDIYFTQSNDGGATFRSPNTRVTTVSSNEHDCDGVFPCSAINYGNQQGDYSGLASYGGVSHPFWTDSRLNTTPASGCRTNELMEEVFTAAVK